MTKVKLREKPMSGNRKSLYLDFYPPIIHPKTGKPTRREFLSLYIYTRPKTYTEKDFNRETKNLAENIRAERQLKIQAQEYGFLDKDKQNQDFILYFDELTEKKKQTTSHSNWSTWRSVTERLKKVAGQSKPMNEISTTFCNDFREYLLANLAQNSASTYFAKFCEAIKKAVSEDLIKKNPLINVKSIPAAETQREFLTLEELRRLSKVECHLEWLKRAALFTSLTGLRFVDVQKLKWSQLQYSKEVGHYIRFSQQKTKGVETLPISKQAFGYLGKRGNLEDKVFEGIPQKMGSWENLRLKEWVLKAKIRKDITFHSFRHTFATLQITYGTDIYTVKKLLGNKDVKTTEIYAKIIDEKKRDAANRIKI